MPTFTDRQALDFLGRLLPSGLGDPGPLAEVCPEGWENSPLFLAFHPSAEQRYEEHCRFFRSPMFRIGREQEEPEPPPTFQEFLADHPQPEPGRIDPLEEWTQLLGDCLWDVISDNHEVLLADGRAVDFGGFRAVGGLVDDFLHRETRDPDSWEAWSGCGYLNFYMGTAMIGHRADLRPVYRFLFTRLRSLGCRWRYVFPRIHMIRFERPKSDTPGDYNPSAALAAAEKKREEDEEHRRLQEKLDRGVAADKRRAWDEAPPQTVQAYQAIYGADPDGWPPEPEEV